MILHEFPDLNWLKRQTETRFGDRKSPQGVPLPSTGWPTVILNVNSHVTYRDDIRGPLSLFTNLAGESSVSVKEKSVIIRDQSYFLSNADQRYTLEVHRKQKAQTFNIHFGEHFLEGVFASLRQECEGLLDNNDHDQSRLNFYNRLHQRSQKLNALVLEIRNNGLSGMALEEKLVDILIEILMTETSFIKQVQSIDTVKSQTKQEIIKRLLLSTDYIQSHYHRDLSLNEVAAASCLSKFHFLRLFKTAFRQTPYQYINRVRVERSRALLLHTKLSVIDVARSVGFHDASSFSRMFFMQTGKYPSLYRDTVKC